MKRVFHFAIVGIVASTVLVIGQGGDVDKILADVRQALGGEKKLAGVKTLAATGRSTRVVDNSTSPPGDFEIAVEFPDKYIKKETLAMMAGTAIARTSGFNGEKVIEAIDRPPQMGGMIVIRGPGDPPPGVTPTPEQKEQVRKVALLSNRQDFTRLMLGLLATSPAVYPVQFSYGGSAQSPDGKADVIDVKGEGDFAARLFIDSQSHLPLMLTWMAREPIVVTSTRGGRGGGRGAAPEEIEEMRNQAESQSKMVEFRLYYGDYQDVDGVKLPFHLQRSIAGKPVEEITLEKIKVNGKIDSKKFSGV